MPPRPRLPSSHRIHVNLTEDLYEFVDRKAYLSGNSASSVIRFAVQELQRREERSDSDRKRRRDRKKP